MIESRKQAVSIRMSPADLRKVKDLARRLSARDSDVIRFAVKAMLGRLAPLFDQQSRGRALVPALVEAVPNSCASSSSTPAGSMRSSMRRSATPRSVSRWKIWRCSPWRG